MPDNVEMKDNAEVMKLSEETKKLREDLQAKEAREVKHRDAQAARRGEPEDARPGKAE